MNKKHRRGNGFSIFGENGNENVPSTTKSNLHTQENSDCCEAILLNFFDWMWELDLEGRITCSSSNAEQCTGYKPGELVGKQYTDLLLPKDRQRFTATFQKALKEKKPIHNIETWKLTKCGRKVCFLSNAVPIINKENQLLSFIGGDRDITENKWVETKIMQSLRQKEMLLREIHHRIKNNLQIISSLLGMQMEYMPDTTTRNILTECQNRILTIDLVHERLYQSENFDNISFDSYIQELVRNLLLTYNVNPRKIITEVNTRFGSLPVETVMYSGLIINELVSNSIKHAFPEGREGKIFISGYFDSQLFKLTIGDNGIGIPQSIDFHTTHSLGLRLVKMLTKQLGGSIKLTNNCGAFFEVTITNEKGGGLFVEGKDIDS